MTAPATSPHRVPPARVPDARTLWRLRRTIPEIAEQAAGAARGRVLAYEWGEGPGDPDPLYTAIAAALSGFLDPRAEPAEPAPAVLDAFRRLGEAEACAGRSPEDLRAALTVATGVVAGRLAEQVFRLGAGVTPRLGGTLVRLGLTCADQVQRAAADGHRSAGARRAGAAGPEHRRLADLLLGPGCAPHELRDAAARAGWTLPRTVAAIAVDARRRPTALPRFLPPDVLSGLHRDVPCLVFPDPAGPGRRAVLETMLGDHPAVVGPPVEVGRAALSLRLARRGLELLPSGMLDGGAPVHVGEHIPTLLLVQDPELTRRLAERRLAPLRRLRPAQRPRMVETLLAYFECGFNGSITAARLHAHPQTVRNRIRAVEPLFGPDLYDPAHALDYLMALHAWRLLPDVASGGPTTERTT